MKTGVWIAIMIILSAFQTLSGAAESSYLIENADSTTIENMAFVRGLDTSLSTEELRSLLLESAPLQEEVVNVASGDESWSLTIVNAQNMEVDDDGRVALEGDVEISFTLEGEEGTKTLVADRMLLDSSQGRLSAYGNVQYSDNGEKSGLESISADIVTYLYESGDLLVSGGTTSTERTTNEDEVVTFYTTGDLLNYRSADSGLFFSGGYLTSDPERAYSSISADSLALLDGGDMFMTDAWLRIGRVPILYLPFFFYPGSRLAINPAFGFNSSRGMFLSTTTEIFGTYPDFSTSEDESSFSSLLRSESDGPMVSNGLYYEEGEPEGGVQAWAADTESHLALLADVYQNAGFLLGYDSAINPSSIFSLESSSAVILSPVTSYYSDNWRWYTVNSLSLSSSFGSLDFTLPLYSDPYVMREYGNRLTSFSIDALFGSSQSFPSTYSGTITSYDASLSGSLSLPSRYRSDLVSTLRLSNIRANASFDWDGGREEYMISDIRLPSFTFTMAGELFSFSTDSVTAQKEEERVSVSNYFVLSDPLLYDLYVLEPARQERQNNEEYSLSLSYNISERFSNTFEIDQDELEMHDHELTSDTSVRFDIDLELASWFSLTQSFTPSYSYDYDESSLEEKNHSFSMLSTTSASIPFIGLTYDFSAWLYRYDKVLSLEGESSEEAFFSFDRGSVRTHSLTLSKSFGERNNYGQITPSLRYTLPPLTSSIEPRLGYTIGGFTSSFAWAFKEDGDGRYKSDDIRLSLGLVQTYFTFSLSMLYQSGEESGRWLDPLSLDASFSLRSEDRRWSISQYLEYDAFASGERNVIDSLRTVLSIPYLDLSVNFTTHENRLALEYFEIRSVVEDVDLFTWKNRIHIAPILDARVRYNFLNPYSSSLSIKTGVSFSIAEFLELNIALTTSNNGFYKYMENDSFSFALMWEDLMRSFDFIGDGRLNTQFNMDALDIELVHYMGDWDLHLRYTASLEASGPDYGWVPTFAVYIRWRTIPDLKVDQTWQQNLSDHSWSASDSIYSD